MICINCGSERAVRNGDNFNCPKCGYAWDVAHEQANAAFLAVQGRIPAEPVAEASTLADEEALPEVPLDEEQGAEASTEVGKGKRNKPAKSDQGDSEIGG